MAGPVKEFSVESLSVRVYENASELSRDVAKRVHDNLEATLNRQGEARAILATGNSQLQFLEELDRMNGIDWSQITLFHMDEYLGLSADHPACFRRYMHDRVEQKLKPGRFHYLGGDALEPIQECDRYSSLLREKPIDLCCLGVGDNGHLAFNDPPVANFKDPHFVKIVKLDEICKTQQVNQGHFPTIDAVPPYALTLTIPALCFARTMICLCPGKHKAKPVKEALHGPVSSTCPASVLRTQPRAELYLDLDSASLL